MTRKKVIVELSQKTIFSVTLLILSLIFFRHTANLIIGLFTSLLVYVAINPLVNFLESKRVPRSVSAFIILVLIFSGLATLVVSLVTPLFSQTQSFLQQLPRLAESLAPYNIDFSSFLPQLSQAPRNVLRIAMGTFSGLVTFFTLLVITFYVLQDRPNLKKYLITLMGEKKADLYYHIIAEIETRLGSWVRGELILMLAVGTLNYLGFLLIGLPSAVPLAVIAGFLELVPNVGPTVAAVPAAIVGFSVSPTHGFMALGLAFLVQQLENNIIVPKVMESSAGLHPVITIISLLIGFQLGGPLLAILSLPIILTIQVFFTHLKKHPEDKEEIVDLS